MSTGSLWLERLSDRFHAKQVAGDGWCRVAEHNLAVSCGGEGQPQIWLTIEDGERPRCVDAWPQLADDDLMAITALLGRPSFHWFHEATRTLATVPNGAARQSAAPLPTTSVIVRGFDASWTPGEGGWLRLRFRRAASCATRFGAADGARFTACVTAASAPDPIFDPRTRSLRSLPDGVAIGGLALSP